MAKERGTGYSGQAPGGQEESADGAKQGPSVVRTKRITLDIALPLHAKIKMHCFEQGISMKEFLLGLAAKELGV